MGNCYIASEVAPPSGMYTGKFEMALGKSMERFDTSWRNKRRSNNTKMEKTCNLPRAMPTCPPVPHGPDTPGARKNYAYTCPKDAKNRNLAPISGPYVDTTVAT